MRRVTQFAFDLHSASNISFRIPANGIISTTSKKEKGRLVVPPYPNTSSTPKMRKIITRPITSTTPSFPSWRLRVYQPEDKNVIVQSNQNFAKQSSIPPPQRQENASSDTSADAWPHHISKHNGLHRSSCSKMRLLLQPPAPEDSLSCFHLQQAVDEIAEEDTATITTSSTARTSRSAPREAESNNDRSCCPERTSQLIRHLSEPSPASAGASIAVSTNAADRRRELQLRALQEAYLDRKGSSISAEDDDCDDDDHPCFSKPGAYESCPTKAQSESTRKEGRQSHVLVVPTATGAPQPALLQTGVPSDRRRRLQLRTLREAYLDRKSSSMSAD